MTININGPSSSWYNLDMIRVWASQAAAINLLKLVEARLSELGIYIDPDS